MSETLVNLRTEYGQCSWCDDGATFSVISDNNWCDYACGFHARKHWSHLFVSLTKECEAGHHCAGGPITRWVIVNDRTGDMEGTTACERGVQILQEAANAHWHMPRTDFLGMLREDDDEPSYCPNGYNDAACDAFCEPGHRVNA